MLFNSDRRNQISILLAALTIAGLLNGKAVSQSAFESYRVVVNSDRDTVEPDAELTLREAIKLVNNTLAYDKLTPTEQQQVELTANSSRIEFNFSAPVKIELERILPPLLSPGLTIDGTTHPSYDPNNTTTVELPIPVPVVTLTPAKGNKILRGLTIAGDRITIKGLSIYGFGQPNTITDPTPGADVAISTRLAIATEEELGDRDFPKPPQDVELLDNWLGLPPDESIDTIVSNFGVWLFDGVSTKIRRNRIYYHGGSGILTSTDVRGTQITENIIVGNGLRGMPHAIYLEGEIENSLIADNLLCGNDGSGVYLFKPEGKITVRNNQIKYNGRRVPSAAVFLIGNDHQILDNEIMGQTGTGVTVAAYPQSIRNLITGNSFDDLKGLSIDLNTRHRVNNPFFKLGDGVNPLRNSGNRKKDTANRAINSPQFLSEDFYLIDGRVNIDGVADPGAEITLYRVEPDLFPPDEATPLAAQSNGYGPLSTPWQKAIADKSGRFSFTLDNPTPGTIVSAIATKPDDGTSEPALNAVIRSLDGSKTNSIPTIVIPNCTTKPIAQVSNPPVRWEADEPVTLRVPTNIHFALDQAKISPTSAEVLNQIATVLKQYPFLTIELQGHTDSRASNQYNLNLSKRRAIAARNYLLQQGIQPERMTILPLGESKLKKPGNTTLEHAYNRRVEVEFQDLRGIDIILEEQNSDLQLESNKEN
ncbi:OmpA family protein [Pleurocapsales cyanobacterium LEGE 10410]|nr:OmpA family protein [Pleurocapsales cyanobacterium LEGE 10410]